ncbi:protein FAM161A isoform X2 [Octodon degus]|uniref:Protein FAM161A n=1 Tax=Octodon degus TaxID=10160 RepID=A0A6P6EWE5_OCTDE|nr:protein FAM161A isoform X2 [Octodon degus]
MAASHREAKLAAASLHLPVNPQTGARVAQYEREDLLEALAAAVSLEEDEKADSDTNSAVQGRSFNYGNIVSFSDIRHSNEEYFRKLEELKAAHIESMAKLEKMYQNKLNLKEFQPATIREDIPSNSSSSVSENSSCHPVVLMTSLSEPDLGQSSSLYTSSSEEELPNLEKEHPGKNKIMNYAKELISNMWKDFCVEDYIQGEDTDFQVTEKTRKKPKRWVPTITIPVPFQMMIREQKKKEAMKSKSDIEIVQKLLKNEEDSECKKKFRANPVPLSVLLPLYHELVKQSEERRRARKEKNRETLLALQKPFTFVAREEQKQAAREKQLRDYFKSKKKTYRFKAKPIPRSTYGSAYSDKLKEEELLRNIRTQLKAQQLLQNSSPLLYRPGYKHVRNPKCPEQAGKLRNKHKARSETPDVEDLPEEYKKRFSEHKCPKFSAVQKPPDLHVTSSKSAERENNLVDEENLKQARCPHLSPRRKSSGRNASAKPASCSCRPPVPTVSSRGRERAIRRSLEEKKMLEEERNRILTKQKQRMKELQKLLTTRAKAYDPHQSLAQMSKSKVKYLRKSEKERMREYRREQEEREEKLKMRPLLFERVSQKNARMAAEKHYSNKLKALGISDEFVSKKGKSGKVFEYFSNQEMKSFTEDKESFNEEKVEERENGEENYFIDTNSQDSCKDQEEDNEESGEVSGEG